MVRSRKVSQVVLRVLAAVMVVLLLLIGGIAGFVHSKWGGDVLRQAAEARLNRTIAGSLHIGRLTVGRNYLDVDSVELKEPGGRRVATVERIFLRWSWLGILHHQLLVEAVDVQSPHIVVASNAAGSDLERALASRQSQPSTSARAPVPPKGPSGWSVWFGALRITAGSAEILRANESLLSLSPFELQCNGSYGDKEKAHLALRCAFESDVLHPLREHATVTLEGTATIASSMLDSRVATSVGLGHSTAHATLLTQSLDLSRRTGGQGRVSVVLRDSDLAPELSKVFSVVRPQGSVRVEGRADWDATIGALAARLRLSSRASHATVQLSAGTDPPATYRAHIVARDINLSDWLAGGPTSHFGVDIRAQGAGRSLADLRASVDATVSNGHIDGMPLGPIRLHAGVAEGRYHLAELVGRAPGLRIRARGRATSDKIAFRMRLDADDLTATSGLLRPFVAPGEIAGRGFVLVGVEGTPKAPSLRVNAAFPTVRFRTNAAVGLSMHAWVPNVRQPLRANTSVKLGSLTVGTRQIRQLALQFRGVGAYPRLALAMTSPEQVLLQASGSWRHGHRAVLLGQLNLGLNETSWSLQRPTLIGWYGATLRVDDLMLRAKGADEYLRLNVQSEKGRTSIDANLHRIRMERLPHSLLPQGLHLAGNVDVELHAHGTRARPRADGVVKVQAVRLNDDISLDGGFLAFQLSGTRLQPAVALVGHAGGLVVQDCSIADLAVSADSRPKAASSVTIQVPVAAVDNRRHCVQAANVSIGTDATLAEVLAGATVTTIAKTAPFHVKAEVRGLDLAGLSWLAGRPPGYGGRVDLEAELDGPLMSPTARVQLLAKDVRANGIPPTDGSIAASLSGRALTAQLRVKRRGLTLATADLDVHAAEALLRLSALADATLRLHATLGPITVQHTSLSVLSSAEKSGTLRGTGITEIDVSGSLSKPRARVDARLTDLRVGDRAWGQAHARLTYSNERAVLEVDAKDRAGGALSIRSQLSVDWGYPYFLQPIAWARRAFTGNLDATDVDLTPLSAVSLRLHDVSGKMNGHVSWAGTVSDPIPEGRLELRDCGATVTDVGRYKNVHLLLHGDRQHVVLETFKLAAGSGSASVVASAAHRPSGGYDIDGKVNVERLPVYSDGQVIADVSLQASAKAVLASMATKAEVAIKSARVAMSDSKRKNIARQKRPSDVIVLGTAGPTAPTGKLVAPSAPSPPGGVPTAKAQSAVPTIVLTAPRNLWLSGNDVSVEIGLEPGFHVETSAPPRIYGGVVVKRGRIDVLGRRFDLEPGSTIRFQGPVDAPNLDIAAHYTSEEERVTVVATIRGTLDHLTTTLSAPDRPDLTESQLYTLVLTGRLGFGPGPASSATPASRAGSILGGLMAGELQKVLAKKLPLDVLTIESGTTAGSAKVEAGTYVTSNVYVGYVGRLGADPTLLQNRNAVRLEYMLGSHWSFQGEYGDAKAGSADVVWTKRY